MKRFNLRKMAVGLMLGLLAGFTACNTEDVDFSSPSITVLPDQLENVPAAGGEFTFQVTAERDWTVSVPSAAESWIVVTPPQGHGNQTVTVRVGQNTGMKRTAAITVATIVHSATVQIIQEAASGMESEVIYLENMGTTEVTGNTNIAEFSGWQRGGLASQSRVTYTGSIMSIRTSNPSPVAEGFSGGNILFFGASGAIMYINNIDPSSFTDFTLSFGISKAGEETRYTTVSSSDLRFSASTDGSTWTPVDLTIDDLTKAGWVNASATFSLREEAENLFFRFDQAPASVIRIDDLELLGGGASGTIIEPGVDIPEVPITLSELRALSSNLVDNKYKLPENYVITATVISDKSGGNYASGGQNVVISDGDAGIMVRFGSEVNYAKGTEIKVNLFEQSLESYNGLLQVNGVPVGNAQETGQTNTIQPKLISAAELVAGEYESMYVGVQNVQVQSEDLSKTIVTGGVNTNINMESSNGETFSMYSVRTTVFGNQTVPQGSGTLYGITGVYEGTRQVSPQQATDFAGLTGQRFGSAVEIEYGEPQVASVVYKVGQEIVDGNITIPYTKSPEAGNVTVSLTLSGDYGVTIPTSAQYSLSVGNGSIIIPVTGTPTTAGDLDVTFTAPEALAGKTAKITIIPSDATPSYGNGVLASWRFSDNTMPKTSNGEDDLTEGGVLSLVNDANPAVNYTGSSQSIYANSWHENYGSRYWLFTIPLTMQIESSKALKFDWGGWGTATAPKYILVEISTDNVTWEEMVVEEYTATNNATHTTTYNLPSAITSSNLYIRILPNNDEPIGADKTVVESGGNMRLANPKFSIVDAQ